MKERISAVISFLGALGWGLFGLVIIFDDTRIDVDDFIAYFTFMISTISTILYVIWTKFGNKEYTELEKLDIENQLLRRQIEQKELKKKLEE